MPSLLRSRWLRPCISFAPPHTPGESTPGQQFLNVCLLCCSATSLEIQIEEVNRKMQNDKEVRFSVGFSPCYEIEEQRKERHSTEYRDSGFSEFSRNSNCSFSSPGNGHVENKSDYDIIRVMMLEKSMLIRTAIN